MTMEITHQVLAAVAERPCVDGMRFIGVDGPSGSGKSTVARTLAGICGAPVVEVDDFVSWNDLDGWWPRFEAQVIRPLREGHDARYQARDWEHDWFGDSLGGWKTTPWHPLVIIEGVTCTRRAALDWLTYAIWVQAPADLRLARGLQRDHQPAEIVRQLWTAWMVKEDRFFSEDATASRADLIVDTSC